MTDKVQLIKKEIEKRLSLLWDLIPEGEKVLKDDFTKDDANNLGKYTELESLLKLIDSLQDEPASEDLEEAASKYVREDFHERSRADFKAGAKWQKQQMKEVLQTEYEKGRFDMREEMMKHAVEAKVDLDLDCNIKLDCEYEFHVGDKVKIIIIKED